MKRVFLVFVIVVMSILAMAQVPQKMNFQALIRNSEDELVTNQTISIKVSVLNNSNTPVYGESHSVTTNANGVVTLVIGEGTVTNGDFASIDWSTGNYYLETKTDLGGGAATISGTTLLLSVPYALYSEKTANTYTKAEVDSLLAEIHTKIDIIEESGTGTGYGESGNVVVESGVIKAPFSVSADKQVYFSMGNLQYNAGTKTWRFAERQYDMIGTANSNVSSTYSGYIDLFGWGTSGWNSGAKANQPYSINTDYTDYYVGSSYDNNLTGAYANADWGVYNAISNGGNAAGLWRTLTKDEWYYLINSRPEASKLYSQS